MYRWLRPLLFLLPAELAHGLGMAVARGLGRGPLPAWLRRRRLRRLTPDLPDLNARRFGLSFPSPVGLAAGMDKEGSAVSGLFALGFGFVEVGTVTPRPQPGNQRPRLFRAPADEALINRMGFNNPGAPRAAANLAGAFRPGPVGFNLGKNKETEQSGAAADYAAAARAVRQVADYLVINVSSPNTPGLRDLQRAERLEPLLKELVAAVAERPILVKFAPDLPEADLLALCDVAAASGVAGLIATNTTSSRPSNRGAYAQAGGLSGRPLAGLAAHALRLAYARVGDRLPIVGVGGLFTPADLLARLEVGASLLQVYTALVYAGPGFAGDAALGLARALRAKGYRSVDEAVGRLAAKR